MRTRPLPPGDVDDRRVDLLTDVATRYYLVGASQTEIARDLDLDPSTVSRYLKRARDEGIVHVEIRPPRREHVDLGREVATRFGVSRVFVAPAPLDIEGVAGVAADFIDNVLRSRMRLGVSWGRTLAAVVRRLRPGAVAELTIAQLAGGIDDPEPGIQGHELVGELAARYPGSRVHYIHAPAIVGSLRLRRALLDDPMVSSALDVARRCELALVGIGQMDSDATLVQGGHVSKTDYGLLRSAGAIGNMNTRFFDADGRPVQAFERRTIAIDWEDLRAIPSVVAVAVGIEKVQAIAGALRTGCVNVLVTDEATASGVLAQAS